jgi:hypothetical protein
MPKLRFTDVAVSQLKERGTYYDITTPAFGVRIGKNRKTFFVIRGRERQRTNVGHYTLQSPKHEVLRRFVVAAEESQAPSG